MCQRAEALHIFGIRKWVMYETTQILGMGCGLLLCDGILYGLQTQIGGNHYEWTFSG